MKYLRIKNIKKINFNIKNAMNKNGIMKDNKIKNTFIKIKKKIVNKKIE